MQQLGAQAGFDMERALLDAGTRMGLQQMIGRGDMDRARLAADTQRDVADMTSERDMMAVASATTRTSQEAIGSG